MRRFSANLRIPVRDFFILLSKQLSLTRKQCVVGSLQRDHQVGWGNDSRHYIAVSYCVAYCSWASAFLFDMIAYSVSLGTAFTSVLIVVAHIVKQEG